MSDKKDMLNYLDIEHVEELFRDIPEGVKEGIDISEGLSEKELTEELKTTLEKNRPLKEYESFLGGGVYRHYIPAAVREIVGRSEFYTSYTPYQAEISQGMLKALFEYQSLICELTGMDAANTSMYDYSTALAEAILMAKRVGKGYRFLLPKNIHWDRKPVIDNYLRGNDIDIDWIEFDDETGQIEIDDLKQKMDDDVLGFYVESPNVFGVLEEETGVFSDLKKDNNSILVNGTSPLALSLMQPPSEWDVDIVVGDSQSVGIPPSFGGPTVGIFACKDDYIRRMPGRMIGETEDQEGRTAYCMTLQTREQHIRRERATSNICTNQSLMALASAAYLFVKGGKGLEEVAKDNYQKAHNAAEKLNSIERFEAPHFDSPFFNEFTVKTPKDASEVIKETEEKEVIPGISLPQDQEDRFSKLTDLMLTTVTEMNSEEEIDHLVDTLEEVG